MVCSDRLKQFNKELLHVAHGSIEWPTIKYLSVFQSNARFHLYETCYKIDTFFFFLNIIVYACNWSAGNENSQLTANLQSTKHPVLDFTVIF